jgi:hypothetical protein
LRHAQQRRIVALMATATVLTCRSHPTSAAVTVDYDA